MVTEIKNCRVCKHEGLSEVLNLGSIFPSGFVSKEVAVPEDAKAPLVLVKCMSCGLVQLKHSVDLDLMYRQYWYSSSLNKSMVGSLKDVVDDALGKVVLEDGDVVVDIGCNDGTMLDLYPQNLRKVGFDPALNLKRKGSFAFYNDYFSSDTFIKDYGQEKAKIVTAIAMFYDLPDPVAFVKEVKNILHKDGIFIVQFTDLLSMFKLTAFDNICHEHYEYYRLADVVNILNLAGLKAVYVSYNDVNGGSIRVTATHLGKKAGSDGSVKKSLIDEDSFFSLYGFKDFKAMIDLTIEKLNGFLRNKEFHNQTVSILGASTKGNTLLQICNIDKTKVAFAADVNKDKFGLLTIGTGIEILSEDDVLIKHPKSLIVPIWHFKENILKNAKILDYLKSGGSLVFPLPEFTVVTAKYDGTLSEVKV